MGQFYRFGYSKIGTGQIHLLFGRKAENLSFLEGDKNQKVTLNIYPTATTKKKNGSFIEYKANKVYHENRIC